MPFEFFIGTRYLRAKRKQAFISLITVLSTSGVTVGVMALIVVIAVMTGAEADFRSRILGVESHLVVLRHGGPMPEYQPVISKIRRIKGVRNATPFVSAQTMIRSSNGVAGAVIRGIDPASAAESVRAVQGVEKLDADPTSDGSRQIPGIVLGKELARSLGAAEGDTVYVISPKGMISPFGHMPTMKRFRVAAHFESGFYEYDSSLAYVHLKEAQKMLRMDDTVTGIEVRVDNIYAADQFARDIITRLGFPYWARDWMQMNRNLFSALKLEKIAMFVILTLIVLVAAFNIASTLIMMVMEKTKDIAILKAMGASSRSIRKIFIFNGMIIGAIGTVMGICLGFILCTLLKHYRFIELPGDVYYFTTLPVQLETADVLTIAAAALLICFVATLYPAHQASKLDPVEAIRYG